MAKREPKRTFTTRVKEDLTESEIKQIKKDLTLLILKTLRKRWLIILEIAFITWVLLFLLFLIFKYFNINF